MNMKRIYRISFSIIILGAWMGLGQAQAGEMVYTPKNPNFGGNPFNAAPLMNSAAAQNGFTAPRAAVSSRAPLTAAQRFAQRLDAAVFSRLTRLAAGAIFEDDGTINPGTINTGINTIDVIAGVGQTIIRITNTQTGEVTEIVVPEIVP